MKAQHRHVGWTGVIFLITVSVLFALMWWQGCTEAHGSPLDCERIRDQDHRHMCRAISRGDRSECELVKQRDLREECRARVTK